MSIQDSVKFSTKGKVDTWGFVHNAAGHRYQPAMLQEGLYPLQKCDPEESASFSVGINHHVPIRFTVSFQDLAGPFGATKFQLRKSGPSTIAQK